MEDLVEDLDFDRALCFGLEDAVACSSTGPPTAVAERVAQPLQLPASTGKRITPLGRTSSGPICWTTSPFNKSASTFESKLGPDRNQAF
mmetsp:Transcript_58574/g.104148  ORF Transcript_58574/g.104148 Transcript_58574/m.104148 type:complete len:89 (-) Transcript_58574:27-293(-)